MGIYEKFRTSLKGFSRLSKKKSGGFQKKGLGKAKSLNFILIGLKIITDALQRLLVFNFFIL